MTTTIKSRESISRVWELLYRTYVLQDKANPIFVTEKDLKGFDLDPEDFLLNLEFLEKLGNLTLPHYDKPYRPGMESPGPKFFQRTKDFFKFHAGIDIGLPKNFESKYKVGKIVTMETLGSKSEQIKKLTLIGSKDTIKYRVVVNDDYDNIIQVGKGKTGSTWKLLWAVATKEPVSAANRKTSFDYLNSNKKCVLYEQTGLKLTKILVTRSGRILPGIPMEIISDKTLIKRLNKLKPA